jgi:hypothetical protein
VQREQATQPLLPQTINGIALCPDLLQTAADKMARLQTAVVALALFGLLACVSAGAQAH